MSWMQLGDTGVIVELTVTLEDEVTPYDLSSASLTEIHLGPPSGDAKVCTATFVTDGTDGKLQYATLAGDIDVAGTWDVQAYWEDGGDLRRSTVVVFDVYPNVVDT